MNGDDSWGRAKSEPDRSLVTSITNLWLSLKERQNFSLHAFAFFANRGFPFFASVIVAKLLDVTEFGHYVTATSLFTALTMFVDAGLTIAATTIVARQPEGNKHAIATALLSAVGACFALGMVMAAALVLFAEALAAHALGDVALSPLLLAGVIYVPASALTSVTTGALQGAMQYRNIAVAGIVGGVAFLACAIQAALTGDALTAIWGAAIGTMIRAVISLFATAGTLQNINRRRNLKAAFFANLQSLWRVAFPASIAALTFAPVNSIMMLLLFRSAGGPNEAGAYGLSLQFFAIAMMAPGMLTQYVLPKLARSNREMPGLSQNTDLSRFALLACAACAIIAVPTAMWAPTVLGHISPNYANYSATLQWIMLAALITAPQGVLANYLVAISRDWLRVGTRIMWAAAILMLALTTDNLDSSQMAKIYSAAGAVLLTSQLLLVRGLKMKRARWQDG